MRPEASLGKGFEVVVRKGLLARPRRPLDFGSPARSLTMSQNRSVLGHARLEDLLIVVEQFARPASSGWQPVAGQE
jgi:hypothetical protein